MELKIGSKGWHCTGKRIYAPGERMGPLKRGEWQPVWIVGETTKSWICHPQQDGKPDDHRAFKIPKKPYRTASPSAQSIYFDGAAVERELWAAEHGHTVRNLAARADGEQLLQIARILGFEILPNDPKPNGEPRLIAGVDYKRGVLVDEADNAVDKNGRPLE